MVDDIAGGFFQRKREVEDGLFRQTLRPGEFLKGFDGAHDFLGRGVQFQRHEMPLSPTLSPWDGERGPTFNARIAMSSDCGAPAAKARTFWSNPAVMAEADWPASVAASASRRSLP